MQGWYWVRVLALLSMFIDHTAWYLLPAEEWMHWLGRVAMPGFCIMAGANVLRTRDPYVYVGRLIFWGMVAQVPYYFVLGLPQLNVLFTLAFGVTIASLGKWRTLGAAFVCGVLIAERLYGLRWCDFGAAGVLLVIIVAEWFDSRERLWVVFGVFLAALLNWSPGYGSVMWAAWSAVSFIVLMYVATIPGKRPEWLRSGWWFYAVYPAHFVVLLLAGWLVEQARML